MLKSQSIGETTGIAVPAGHGRAVWVLGDRYLIKLSAKESGGAYSILEGETLPRGGPPPHIHHREDENFFVLDGEHAFLLGDQRLSAPPGTFVHVPKGTVHTFQNVGATAGKVLIVLAPGGFEELLERVGQPDDGGAPPPADPDQVNRIVNLSAEYHLEIVAPR